jgi:uncharacterized protein (UPF0128 family)
MKNRNEASFTAEQRRQVNYEINLGKIDINRDEFKKTKEERKIGKQLRADYNRDNLGKKMKTILIVNT